jgi:hypothetical protein
MDRMRKASDGGGIHQQNQPQHQQQHRERDRGDRGGY